jgi:hypothetical protein
MQLTASFDLFTLGPRMQMAGGLLYATERWQSYDTPVDGL